MESGSFAARNRFGRDGRVGRIATPTPLGVGDSNSHPLLPPNDRDGLTPIDTGVNTPASFAALQNGSKEFGVEWREIERILVTHAHMDHFGQAKLHLRVIAKPGHCNAQIVFHAPDEGAVVLEERDGVEFARAPG